MLCADCRRLRTRMAILVSHRSPRYTNLLSASGTSQTQGEIRGLYLALPVSLDQHVTGPYRLSDHTGVTGRTNHPLTRAAYARSPKKLDRRILPPRVQDVYFAASLDMKPVYAPIDALRVVCRISWLVRTCIARGLEGSCEVKASICGSEPCPVRGTVAWTNMLSVKPRKVRCKPQSWYPGGCV